MVAPGQINVPGRGEAASYLFDRAPRKFLILALLFYAVWGQGARGLWNPDEGRYTCVALNMLSSGDWLVPRLNDEKPHFTKPPLTYWAVAASLGLFGRHEWAARLPGSLAFMGTVLLILAMSVRLSPRRPFLPALIYATAPLPYFAANVVTTDALLTFCETLAMYAFVEWWHRQGERNRGLWLWLMWTAWGLAFLTKGPPGLLPLLPLIVFMKMQRGWPEVRGMFSWAGLILFAGVGLTWYLVVIGLNPGLFGYFIGDEVYGRIITGQHHRNAQWYGALTVYLPTLLLGALPWNLVLLRKWREKNVQCSTTVDWTAPEVCAADRLLLLWFGIPLVILCIARSRLPFYPLPLFVPLSFFLGRRFSGIDLSRGQWRWLTAGWIVLLASARLIGGMVPSEKNTHAFAAAIERQIGPAPREIVFVNASPYFGLRFYLDAEVERVDFTPKNGEETLEHEIAAKEDGILFIVRHRDEEAFRLTQPPAGCTWIHLGECNQSALYTYDPSLKKGQESAYATNR